MTTKSKKKKRKMMLGAAAVLVGVAAVCFFLVSGNQSTTQDSMEADGLPGASRTIQSYNDTFLSLTGFAVDGVHDRTDAWKTAAYRSVSDERELFEALLDAQEGKVSVIEICEDMYLGYQELALTDEERVRYHFVSPHEKPHRGYTNPVLEQSGISKIDVADTEGLTIFSQNGATLYHCEWKLTRPSRDIVFRNLVFDEMWQWDEAGTHKESGWTFIKVNGAADVWIDHCTFTIAADGNIDIENGSDGVTISWCKIGLSAQEAEDLGGISDSVGYMEQRYQSGELSADSRYYKLREGGATPEEIMAYTAYHSKCHLVGSGDKDYVDGTDAEGNRIADGNANLELTLAWNYYQNIGQRVPMIRQGRGHMINCYLDDSTHARAAAANEIFSKYGSYTFSRALNARNGASIGADTCVFRDVEKPVVGAEYQGMDTGNMNAPWDELFAQAENRVLIVNSRVVNDEETYDGSSWDSDGDNAFTSGFTWKDKRTIGNWAWKSAIVGAQEMEKGDPPSEPFTFVYDQEWELPYTYQALPLDEVEETVAALAGAGRVKMDRKQWLQTSYEEYDVTEPESFFGRQWIRFCKWLSNL